MGLINKVGACICGTTAALYLHEMVTGGGYIVNVKAKFVAIYGMTPLAAHSFAAAVILIVPLIACTGMLALKTGK